MRQTSRWCWIWRKCPVHVDSIVSYAGDRPRAAGTTWAESEAHALAGLQSIHHLLHTSLFSLFALGFADGSYPFLLLGKRQRFPSLLGSPVGSDHLLNLVGDFNHARFAVAL